METERANDLKAFRDFADAQLANCGASLTLDEALSLWEHENASDDERAETLQAIHEGLDDMHDGRTRPFEEFDREFRRRHGLPPAS